MNRDVEEPPPARPRPAPKRKAPGVAAPVSRTGHYSRGGGPFAEAPAPAGGQLLALLLDVDASATAEAGVGALAALCQAAEADVQWPDTARERRLAWRPLAAYRAAHAHFEPTFAEEAALALELWGDLARVTFDGQTLKSIEAKTMACDLALLVDWLFTGGDAKKYVNAVLALGRAGAIAVERATTWVADDVRCVLNLVAAVGANPAASVALFTQFHGRPRAVDAPQAAAVQVQEGRLLALPGPQF